MIGLVIWVSRIVLQETETRKEGEIGAKLVLVVVVVVVLVVLVVVVW